MSLKLSNYLTSSRKALFEKFGVENLLEGINIEYNGKIYNVQIIQIELKDIELIISRIYSTKVLSFEAFYKDKQSNLKKKRYKLDYPTPSLWKIMKEGKTVNKDLTPEVFRDFSEREQQFLNAFPSFSPMNIYLDLPPADDTSKGWSTKQKSVAFVATFLFFSGAAYGAHRKGWIPSRKDITSFIEQKKASVAEMWREWHKQPEAQTKV